MEREFGSSLFERIRETVEYPLRPRSKAALLCSLRNNLRNVLNTRSGSCHGSPELGVTYFNGEASELINLRDWIVRAIRECVLRYEPRISDVKIMVAEDTNYLPLELRFHIVAYMNFSDSKDLLEFDILLDNHQHWCVE